MRSRDQWMIPEDMNRGWLKESLEVAAGWREDLRENPEFAKDLRSFAIYGGILMVLGLPMLFM